MKRQLTQVARLRPGDRLITAEGTVTVARLTGTPGRNPRDGVRKRRVHLEGGGYQLRRPDEVVGIEPR